MKTSFGTKINGYYAHVTYDISADIAGRVFIWVRIPHRVTQEIVFNNIPKGLYEDEEYMEYDPQSKYSYGLKGVFEVPTGKSYRNFVESLVSKLSFRREYMDDELHQVSVSITLLKIFSKNL